MRRDSIYLVLGGAVTIMIASLMLGNPLQLTRAFVEQAYSLNANLFREWAFVEVLSPIFNQKMRAVHDYLADTVVVKIETT
jgi:uncharacterized RDD family membrane protein YckC